MARRRDGLSQSLFRWVDHDGEVVAHAGGERPWAPGMALALASIVSDGQSVVEARVLRVTSCGHCILVITEGYLWPLLDRSPSQMMQCALTAEEIHSPRLAPRLPEVRLPQHSLVNYSLSHMLTRSTHSRARSTCSTRLLARIADPRVD